MIFPTKLWVFAGSTENPGLSTLGCCLWRLEDLFFLIQLKCCDQFETPIHSHKIIFGQSKIGLSVINHHKHKKSSPFHQALVSKCFKYLWYSISQLLETRTWNFSMSVLSEALVDPSIPKHQCWGGEKLIQIKSVIIIQEGTLQKG